MAIIQNETVQYLIDNIQDDQILVYDANTGAFHNESVGSLAANVQVTGQGRNIGATGVGLYKANDGSYLEFYKLNAGGNATISLNDNVITIDAVVGQADVEVQTSNANTVAVYDSNGNIVSGANTILVEDDTLTIVGANNNVSIADGVVTANEMNVASFSLGGNFSLPTVDGNANQILVTDGNGVLTWQDNTDISGKLDSILFNAHVATAITNVANHAPALHNLYSLGNSTNKYSQVFSTYFRGTADLAVNSQNLGSQPAANYMLRSDTYDADMIDALIANVSAGSNSVVANANVTFTDGTNSYTSDTVKIVSADANILVHADPVTKDITLTSNVDHVAFTRIQVDSNVSSRLIADRVDDVLNFVAGTGIALTANPSTDTITISSTVIDTDVDAQTLSLSGNTLTISGSNSSVDLSSFAGSGGSGNSNVSVISDLTDVASITGITNGQALLWSSANNQFEAGNVSSSNVSASTISVGTRTGSVTVNLDSGGSTLTVLGRTGNVAVSLS